MRCSKCGKIIIKGTRYVMGDRGGVYHISCVPKKTKPYKYVKKVKFAKNEFG